MKFMFRKKAENMLGGTSLVTIIFVRHYLIVVVYMLVKYTKLKLKTLEKNGGYVLFLLK